MADLSLPLLVTSRLRSPLASPVLDLRTDFTGLSVECRPVAAGIVEFPTQRRVECRRFWQKDSGNE